MSPKGYTTFQLPAPDEVAAIPDDELRETVYAQKILIATLEAKCLALGQEMQQWQRKASVCADAALAMGVLARKLYEDDKPAVSRMLTTLVRAHAKNLAAEAAARVH